MESKADMLSRVCLMAEGSETWDLSDNDTRALRHVLAERNEFKQSSELSALRIRELEGELAEARLDRARMDWLELQVGSDNVRAAIDAAMTEAK